MKRLLKILAPRTPIDVFFDALCAAAIVSLALGAFGVFGDWK